MCIFFQHHFFTIKGGGSNGRKKCIRIARLGVSKRTDGVRLAFDYIMVVERGILSLVGEMNLTGVRLKRAHVGDSYIYLFLSPPGYCFTL